MFTDVLLPRFRERVFRRQRASVPAARHFVRDTLLAWDAPTPAGDVLLCVSELATNALVHGVPPGRGFRVVVWLDHDGLLRIEVHDSGDGLPRLVRPADDEERGRGLLLVESLADRWGVGRRDPGKVVWCEFGPYAHPCPCPGPRPVPLPQDGS